jgi:hypothetical protein
MAMTKAQLQALSESNFPTNGAKSITAAKQRAFNSEMIDAMVTADQIPAGITVGTMIITATLSSTETWSFVLTRVITGSGFTLQNISGTATSAQYFRLRINSTAGKFIPVSVSNYSDSSNAVNSFPPNATFALALTSTSNPNPDGVTMFATTPLSAGSYEFMVYGYIQ